MTDRAGGPILNWGQYVDLLKPAEDAVSAIPGELSDQIRADLYRQFVMTLSQGYFLYFQSDSNHPEWSPLWNSAFLAQPNPDDIYYYAPVDDSGLDPEGAELCQHVVGTLVHEDQVGLEPRYGLRIRSVQRPAGPWKPPGRHPFYQPPFRQRLRPEASNC